MERRPAQADDGALELTTDNRQLTTPLAWIDQALAELRGHDLLRTRRQHDGSQGPELLVAGRRLLNFGSNDYLGLAADPRLALAAAEAASQFGWGAAASPLVTGYNEPLARLEARLAAWEQTDSAVVFASGFAANLGTVAALVGATDAVFSDALNHASLIDGCRLSRAAIHVYRHADPTHLDDLLRRHPARRRLVVTDTVFSMDGDLAPLPEIAEIAARHGAMLLVDEAHAGGVFGPTGAGLASALALEAQVTLRVGTLSKALGCLGGFVAGSHSACEWLVQRARPYVFSTALPPPLAAAATTALELVAAEPDRRVRVLALAADLRHALRAAGWEVGQSASQIVPLLVGTPARALRLSQALVDRGIWVPAIRPPSVPAGTSRLRISLSALHTPAMLEQLLGALAEIARVIP